MSGAGASFLLSFVPLFVAIDAIGTLPIVVGMSEGMPRPARRRMVNIGILTATAVALFFLLLGKGVLLLLGIEVAHFAIAGGLVLLVLSVRDLTTGRMMDMPAREEMVAVVPIGTPLTVGPATVTALIVLSNEHGIPMVLAALLLNLALAWLVFWFGHRVVGFLGQGGVKAVSKVASLLLAAIAVRMILRGFGVVVPLP